MQKQASVHAALAHEEVKDALPQMMNSIGCKCKTPPDYEDVQNRPEKLCDLANQTIVKERREASLDGNT